jgi:PEGA domain
MLIGFALLVVPATAGAQGGDSGGAPDAKTLEARKHFVNGVKLYGEHNFEGALTEFDAAYRLKPGASTLKNIALCQKELFRYTDAVDTLERLLERHGKELSPEERKAVDDAAAELGSLIGSVTVRVTPSKAKVSLDGKALTRAELAGSIRLNTGEHTLTAEAPGFARVQKTIRVAGGQKNVPLELTLLASGGMVNVTTNEPNAAIAIDGKALAFFQWRGPLEPGRHYVQVYGEGLKNYDQAFVVELGKTVDLDVKLQHLPPGQKKPDDKPTIQGGYYVLGALSALGLRNDPEGLKIDPNKASGASLGVRAGYRIWTPIAVELLLEAGRHTVEACDKNAKSDTQSNKDRTCDGSNPLTRSFQLDSVRLGPNLRVMSGGETIRFTSVAGVGAVRHQMHLDPVSTSDKNDGASTQPLGGDAHGWDPYFLVEVGAQYNWGHVLLELDGLLFIDGASQTKGTLDQGGGEWKPFSSTGGLFLAGIGLRAGWSEWEPK